MNAKNFLRKCKKENKIPVSDPTVAVRFLSWGTLIPYKANLEGKLLPSRLPYSGEFSEDVVWEREIDIQISELFQGYFFIGEGGLILDKYDQRNCILLVDFEEMVEVLSPDLFHQSACLSLSDEEFKQAEKAQKSLFGSWQF